jgi:hypothetical protein|tara:strand:+ start:181 stop:951 length:771 start_codon:yes stop_codon:yes gene_type:complete
MPNTIQVKRFNTAGDTPTSRGAQLAYGELCVNTVDKKLWVGTNVGTNVMLSNAAVAATAPTTEQGALWYDTTVGQLKIWDGGTWQITSGTQVSVIDDLNDVDTTSVAPTSGDLLYFDGINWGPTRKTTERRSIQTVQQGTVPGVPIPVDVSNSGLSCTIYGISTNIPARVALYNNDVTRNNDMGRVYPTPPAANTVLFEGTTLSGGTIDMAPLASYVGTSLSLVPLTGTFIPIIVESQGAPMATLQVDIEVLVLEF